MTSKKKVKNKKIKASNEKKEVKELIKAMQELSIVKYQSI